MKMFPSLSTAKPQSECSSASVAGPPSPPVPPPATVVIVRVAASTLRTRLATPVLALKKEVEMRRLPYGSRARYCPASGRSSEPAVAGESRPAVPCVDR